MPKLKISVTVEAHLIDWIDREVKSLRFRNRSHAVEYALDRLKKSE